MKWMQASILFHIVLYISYEYSKHTFAEAKRSNAGNTIETFKISALNLVYF